MDILLWIVCIVLVAFGALPTLGNWDVLVRGMLLRRSGSTIPVIGGICILLGLLACPVPAVSKWWYLGLIVDPTIPLYAVFIPWWAATSLVKWFRQIEW